MIEATTAPLIGPVSSETERTPRRLSPWERYLFQTAHTSLQSKGVRVPQIRDASVFRDGLRYDSSGSVLPVGWSAVEIESGEFTEFEMMIQTLTGEYLIGRAGNDPSGEIFRKNPTTLSPEERALFEEDAALTADAVITAVAHTPPDILNQP